VATISREIDPNEAFQITLKPGVDADELDTCVADARRQRRGEKLTSFRSAKQTAIEQGGKIVHESKLIKSITSVSKPISRR
jgi:hypothetical protein